MRRRRDRDRWAAPAPGGKPPTEPAPVFDLYPNPLPPPPPPVTRECTLVALQAGLATLTDDEVKVARLWLIGKSLDATCRFLQMDKQLVRTLWQSMRRKLRVALKPTEAR